MGGICNSVGGGVSLTWHRDAGAGGECRSVLQARVVNPKQVDVAASTSDHSGCPGMR